MELHSSLSSHLACCFFSTQLGIHIFKRSYLERGELFIPEALNRLECEAFPKQKCAQIKGNKTQNPADFQMAARMRTQS